MTTYRLMDGASGRPGSGPGVTSYSGNFEAGIRFGVSGQMMWLDGFYWWVPTGGDTGAQKFCLWDMTSASTQVLVPDSTVTSGTLTAGAWNYIALSTPIQLAPNTQYVAATAWSAVHGFPDTNSQFASGDPYSAGITNGPLTAYGDGTAGGTNTGPYPTYQGLFSVAGTDPTASMPNGGSLSSNFWIDVLVDDTAPSGYAGSYRVWPNKYDAEGYSNDTATNFTLGMEFSLSETCTLDAIWFYSPSGVTQLPTECAIYNVGTTSIVSGTHNTSPSWKLPSGSAASAGGGWMYTAMPGSVSLAASTNYKVVVYNGAGSPAVWNGATAGYWTSGGAGASGLTAGPITVPNTSSATSPGQDSYNSGTPITYPGTNIGPYNYWVDVEVTPVTTTPVSGSDTGSGADAGTLAAALAGADTGSGADTASMGAQLPGADTAGGADTATLAAQLAAADTATGADTATLAVALSASDTATGTDTASVQAGGAPSGSDTGTGADTAAVAAQLAGADTGTGADSGSLAAAISAADTATGTDSASVNQGGTSPSGADTATGTDSASVAVAVTAADTARGSDGASVPGQGFDPGGLGGTVTTPDYAGALAYTANYAGSLAA